MKKSAPYNDAWDSLLMKRSCYLCSYDATASDERPGDRVDVDCPNCGKYALTGSAESEVEIMSHSNRRKISLLSHKVRKAQKNDGTYFRITTYLIKAIDNEKLPTPVGQVDNLILWMGDNSIPGEKKKLRAETHQAILGAHNRDGFEYILRFMFKATASSEALLEESETLDDDGASLTIAGWERYERLRKGIVESRKAFMAMRFGEKDLDEVFQSCFRPAVQQTGFELQTVLENPVAGLIDEKIRVEIRLARFVIADLTHENNGAYWEAGFAEGLGKPVIYTCRKDIWEKQKTHFDTNHHQTIIWDLESPQQVAKDLKATIRATLPSEAIMVDSQN